VSLLCAFSLPLVLYCFFLGQFATNSRISHQEKQIRGSRRSRRGGERPPTCFMPTWAGPLALAAPSASLQPSMLVSRAGGLLPSMDSLARLPLPLRTGEMLGTQGHLTPIQLQAEASWWVPRARPAAGQGLRRQVTVTAHLVTACVAARGCTVCTESARDVLTEDEFNAISASVGEQPPSGRFLRGRHGTTHFYLQAPDSGCAPLKSLRDSSSAARLVVMAHGLGTNIHLYDEMVGPLLDDGFAVLRYDYFGHGWSVPDNKYFVYDKTVMLEQLEDLLDHVIGTGGTVHGFVGHSTGGCAAVLAASHLKDYSFERLLLVSPCFWKQAPLVSNLAGKIPGVVMALLRSGKFDFIPQNDYETAGIIGWMREGGDGKYVFPDAVKQKKAADDLMFRHHPFVAAAIASLDLYILNNALMPSYREMMREVVAGGMKVRVLWGAGDQTVPHR